MAALICYQRFIALMTALSGALPDSATLKLQLNPLPALPQEHLQSGGER